MKPVFTLLLLFFLTAINAQHKKFFFDDIYFSGMAGNQVYETSNDQWKNMYANRSNIPYLLDTMKNDFVATFFKINAQGAISVMLAKSLINKKSGWMHDKKLEWRTGLYYKTTKHNPASNSFVTSLYYPSDTSKPFTVTNVTLQQKKQLLEWQHMINFKTAPFCYDLLRLNIGSGFAISRTVKNSIHEKYYQTTYTWSTAQHRFLEQNTPFNEADFKARPETSLSYVFYLGTELKLSAQMSLLSDFHYTIAHYKYNTLAPKTESYWLGLTFRYGLNQ